MVVSTTYVQERLEEKQATQELQKQKQMTPILLSSSRRTRLTAQTKAKQAAAVPALSHATKAKQTKKAPIMTQFKSDEELRSSWIYWWSTLLNYTLSCWFHQFTSHGLDNIPAGESAMLVGMHTTHNTDIFLGLTGFAAKTGRVPRGLIHRVVFAVHGWWIQYMGLVPGQRETAVELLRQGFVVPVLPGGAEEALTGHENAYKLHQRWETRRGYAHVAKQANAKIYPFFMKNAEEMRFNPLFYLCNLLKLYVLFEFLTALPIVGSTFKLVGEMLWFTLSWLAIPIPVKVTSYVGPAVECDLVHDSVDEIARKTHRALQDLIDKHQKKGHLDAYVDGVAERFSLGQYSSMQSNRHPRKHAKLQ